MCTDDEWLHRPTYTENRASLERSGTFARVRGLTQRSTQGEVDHASTTGSWEMNVGSRMQLGRLVAFLLITILSARHGSGHLIDGIFTEPNLRPGYNLVTSVPRGARALNVTELGHTSNILAVRRQGREYLLNGGDNAVTESGSFAGAGTTFVYRRRDSHHLESVAAEGPLDEPVDVLVFCNGPNPGIVYRYIISGDEQSAMRRSPTLVAATSKTWNASLPSSYYRRKNVAHVKNRRAGDEAPSKPPIVPNPQRRLRKRKFVWKNLGMTDCNRFCGGGAQVTRFICVREQSQIQVPERRCHHIEKPIGQPIRCNTRPCPAKWRAGAWSGCSVSCGSGFRSRDLECVQEVTPVLTMRVADGACIQPKVLPVREACALQPCSEERAEDGRSLPEPTWNADPWTKCSASCGPGRRTRIVSCATNNGRPCPPERKPLSEESCDFGTCDPMPAIDPPVNPNATVTSNEWLSTEWSRQCSADCGTGVQWRRVVCRSRQPETCDESAKPKTVRECSTDSNCSGHWFAGPWTRCSAACELGEQTRNVICVARIRDSLRIALEMNCPAEKPETKRHCRGPSCAAAWFTSDWTECTRSCGRGMQQRRVECLESDGRLAEAGMACATAERPALERICNENPCKDSSDVHRAGGLGRRVVQIQNDPEISNRPEKDFTCEDTISSCLLVVQARLCSYKVYRRTCCLSCSLARQFADA